MPEYFIKTDFKAEAQGPFNPDELKKLVDTGNVTPQTLHFYDDLVGWQPIQANAPLSSLLFHGKPKLSLKKPSAPAHTPSNKKTQPGLTVEDMLQSAQGNTDATRAQTLEKQWADRVAALSLPILTLLTLFMGGLLIFANWEVGHKLIAGDFQQLILSPGLPIGIVLVGLGILLLLTMVAVYPGVRYTALVLMGYLALQSWVTLAEGISNGWLLLMAGVAFGLGVLIVTLTLNFLIFALATILSFAGVACYAYFIFLGL